MSKVHSALVVAILSSILVACSGGGSSSNSSASSSPGKTVEAFVMAGNAGDYAKAEKYLTASSIENIKSLGMNTMFDMMTRKGTVKSVEIVSETPVGDGQMSVYVLLHFKDDTVSDGTYPLVKEGDGWKVQL